MKNLILFMTPQSIGTKLIRSIFKQIFGCKNVGAVEEGEGFYLTESAEGYPQPQNGFIEAGHLADNPQRNKDIVKAAKNKFTPENTFIVFPIRDYDSVMRSLKNKRVIERMGESLEEAEIFHQDCLFEIISLMKEYKNISDVHCQWISYEFLTYEPSFYINILSKKMKLPIILNDSDFYKVCKTITPQNKKHYKHTNLNMVAPHHLVEVPTYFDTYWGMLLNSLRRQNK